MPKNKAISLVEVSIIQPRKGTLYLWGMSLPILPSATIIIGNITVLMSAISLQLIGKLEFYVDDTLKVVAYDKGGNTVSDEIDVRIFNI